jgi:hypothetical protein
MKIIPDSHCCGHQTGSIHGLTAVQIKNILGFASNVRDDDSKVKYSWGFRIGSEKAAVWDYKGSAREKEFSTWGDHATLRTIFGKHYFPG